MSITTSDCVESIWFKWGHFSAAKLESRVAKYVYHSFVHRSAKSERKQVTKKSEKGEFFRDGQRGNKSFFSWIECHFPAASSQHIMKNKLTQTQCKMKNGSKYRISAKNIWPSQTHHFEFGQQNMQSWDFEKCIFLICVLRNFYTLFNP